MRLVVTGGRGMLGTDVCELARDAGHEVLALGSTELDVRDAGAVGGALRGADVVVNCAAWTAVDDAEADEPAAFAVNAVGAANVARAATSAGARLVHVSTDYVFSGDATEPYAESAPLAPRSAYGRTKAAGEWAVRAEAPDHLLLRTAWLYGAHGPCFPATMVRLVEERGAVSVVEDQQGQPTWTVDVADLALRLLAARAPAGTYHATSGGQASWYEFARAVVGSSGQDPEAVSPTTSDAFPRPAPRPAYSVLGHDDLTSLGVDPIGPWRQRWDVASAAVLGARRRS